MCLVFRLDWTRRHSPQWTTPTVTGRHLRTQPRVKSHSPPLVSEMLYILKYGWSFKYPLIFRRQRAEEEGEEELLQTRCLLVEEDFQLLCFLHWLGINLVLNCVGFLCMFFWASGKLCNQTPHRSSEGSMVALWSILTLWLHSRRYWLFSGPLSVRVKPAHCRHVCVGFLRVLRFPPTLNQSINN